MLERVQKMSSLEAGLDDYHDEKEHPQEHKRRIGLEKLNDEHQAFKEKLAKRLKTLESDHILNEQIYERVKDFNDMHELRSMFPDKTERKRAVEVFKTVWNKRVDGLGAIRQGLLIFLKEKPDRSKDDILKLATEIASNYDIPSSMVLNTIDPIIERYQKVRTEIGQMTDDDAKQILQNFKYQIDAKITQIERRVFDIQFSGSIREHVSNSDHSASTTKQEVEGGVKFRNTPITVNGNGTESTGIHEEQHHIHEIVNDEENTIFSESLKDALGVAKDELLARFRDAEMDISSAAKRYLNPKSSWCIKTDGYEKVWKNLKNEDLDKYCTLVDTAAHVIMDLLMLYDENRERVIGVLQKTPLDQWLPYSKKITERSLSGNIKIEKEMGEVKTILEKANK